MEFNILQGPVFLGTCGLWIEATVFPGCSCPGTDLSFRDVMGLFVGEMGLLDQTELASSREKKKISVDYRILDSRV